MAWKCPQCDEINYEDSFVRCVCGYEIDREEQEKQTIELATGEDTNGVKRKDENPFMRLKFRSLLLWFVLISFGSGMMLSLFEEYTSYSFEDSTERILLNIIFNLLFIIFFLSKFSKFNIEFKRIVGFSFISQSKWLSVIVVLPLFMFSMGAIWLVYYPLSFLTPSYVEHTLNEKSFLVESELLLDNSLSVFLLIFLGPITEEILFRGILLHRWTVKWNIRRAILISSLIFGIIHVDIIGSFVFGFVMSVLYIKTRTLIVPITCHMLNNLFVMVLSLIPAANTGNEQILAINEFQSFVWIGLACFILSVPWVVYFMYRNWPNNSWSAPYFSAHTA